MVCAPCSGLGRSAEIATDQEQHDLAAPRSLVECALPALAGSDAPFGVKITRADKLP